MTTPPDRRDVWAEWEEARAALVAKVRAGFATFVVGLVVIELVFLVHGLFWGWT